MVLAWNIPQRKIETFVYDFNDRLRGYTGYSFSTGLKRGIYTYDALGRRFQKTVGTQTTRSFHDGWSVLFETNGAGTLSKSYVLGPRIDEILQSTGQNFLYDGLGSVTGLSNASGAKTATYGYDAFGTLRFSSGTASNANNYLYTGRELDRESNLYNYRNRYYNPQVGRFLTKDPIGLRGGVNYYQYVRNNPTDYIDPYGLFDPMTQLTDSEESDFMYEVVTLPFGGKTAKDLIVDPLLGGAIKAGISKIREINAGKLAGGVCPVKMPYNPRSDLNEQRARDRNTYLEFVENQS